MQRQRDGLLSIWEAFDGLGVPVISADYTDYHEFHPFELADFLHRFAKY